MPRMQVGRFQDAIKRGQVPPVTAIPLTCPGDPHVTRTVWADTGYFGLVQSLYDVHRAKTRRVGVRR